MCRFNIIIEYETSPSASALQWLTAQQTCGKKHPYLFSQGQVYIYDLFIVISFRFSYFTAQFVRVIFLATTYCAVFQIEKAISAYAT